MKWIAKLGDLRFAIGLFFTVIGILLLVTSLVSGNDVVEGIRLNFVTGGTMAIFGAGMLLASQSKG